MKKTILMIMLSMTSVAVFAQSKTTGKSKAVLALPNKQKSAAKSQSSDSVLVAKADLQSLLKNYYEKVDRAAIADKLQIEVTAGNEKKAIEKYYQLVFPEPKPVVSDTTQKSKQTKKQ